MKDAMYFIKITLNSYDHYKQNHKTIRYREKLWKFNEKLISQLLLPSDF